MTPVSTEAEMGGMHPWPRKPGAAEDGEAEKTYLWGLWEELSTPTPDVGLSEPFRAVLSLLVGATLLLQTQDINPTGRKTRPTRGGVGGSAAGRTVQRQQESRARGRRRGRVI